jgi:hypothetical protein
VSFLQLRSSHRPLQLAQCPVVTTQATTDITDTTATGNGTVVSVGGSALTERGVCWSTSLNPTVADSKATSAGQAGAYTVSITGLSASTTYFARAYAINATCTEYGENDTFTTTGVAATFIYRMSLMGVS